MTPLYTYSGQLLVVDGTLAAGQDCCCTETETETPTSDIDCPTAYAGYGWYTDGAKAGFEALLQSAGYINVIWTPSQPFVGAEIPYTDGCGQTYYLVTAECCGQTFGCDPTFTTGMVAGLGGAGNIFPPCPEEVEELNFVETCCNNPLP